MRECEHERVSMRRHYCGAMPAVSLQLRPNIMARIKSLNGLPNEIVQKYISTMMYYDKGYMPDWINKRLKELNISNAEIDILNGTSVPSEFIIEPIIYYFPKLRDHMQRRLIQFGFESNYITQGIFKINITNMDAAFSSISIQCILTTKEGRNIIGKNYRERTYPIADSFLNKLIKTLKNQP